MAFFRWPTDTEHEYEESEEEIEANKQLVVEKATREYEFFLQVSGCRHIMPVESIQLDGERPCFLMPYYSQGNLRILIERGCLTTTQKIQIARDILTGIKELHSRKICQGDVKGENIVVDESFRAVITDLGGAYVADDEEQMNYETYRIFNNIFSQLFDPKDGRVFAFVSIFLRVNSSHSCLSSAKALDLFNSRKFI
jgi:serine/threonine protein kinase